MSARTDRRLLAQQYPLAFSRPTKGVRKQALKLGIIEDLIQRGVMDEDGWPMSSDRITAAANDFKHGPRYAHALARGGFRYDLDGQPCGYVSRRVMEQQAERIVRMGWQNHDGKADEVAA